MSKSLHADDNDDADDEGSMTISTFNSKTSELKMAYIAIFTTILLQIHTKMIHQPLNYVK